MSTADEHSFFNTLRSPRALRTELLAGLTVALSIIPGTLAFSLIVGVDPAVGMFAACVMSIAAAVVGGFRGLVSGPSAAISLILAPLMASRGLDFLLAAVILSGVIQLLLAAAGFAKLMRLVTRPVLRGFVNALSVLVVLSQVPDMIEGSLPAAVVTAVALLSIWGFTKLTRHIPAPLIAVVLFTVIVQLMRLDILTVGDRGALPSTLPHFALPQVPFTLDTLWVILPFSASIAVIGLLESLLTGGIVDEVSKQHSNKTRASFGQGVANVATGFFGGMGGSGLLGQSMVNAKVSGARTNIAAFTAGMLLLVMSVTIGDLLALIPIAVLNAVMIFVSIVTFDWHSIKPSTLRRTAGIDIAVMVLTMAVILATNNIAIGVGAGVLLALLARLTRRWRRGSASSNEG